MEWESENLVYTSSEPTYTVVPEVKHTPVIERITEDTVGYVPVEVRMQDGSTVELMSAVRGTRDTDVIVGDTEETIGIIRYESGWDIRNFYPTLGDYGALIADVWKERADLLVAEAGWDTEGLN